MDNNSNDLDPNEIHQPFWPERELGWAWDRMQDWGLPEIFPILRTAIWHTTSWQGLCGIASAGQIDPVGNHPYTYGQSGNSYALQIGAVAVFDFESATEDECAITSDRWAQFFLSRAPINVALELDRSALPSSLVPNHQARLEGGYSKVWIPRVEAWHTGPIPVTAVKRALLIAEHGVDWQVLDISDGTISELASELREIFRAGT